MKLCLDAVILVVFLATGKFYPEFRIKIESNEREKIEDRNKIIYAKPILSGLRYRKA